MILHGFHLVHTKSQSPGCCSSAPSLPTVTSLLLLPSLSVCLTLLLSPKSMTLPQALLFLLPGTPFHTYTWCFPIPVQSALTGSHTLNDTCSHSVFLEFLLSILLNNSTCAISIYLYLCVFPPLLKCVWMCIHSRHVGTGDKLGHSSPGAIQLFLRLVSL